MAAALTLLLVGSLLRGSLCGEFRAVMPATMGVLSGSCVTIPCSFDIPDRHESNLDNTCTARWTKYQRTFVSDGRNPQQTTINGTLMKKDCTTTLNNMRPEHSNTYYLRVECNNALKYTFRESIVISVKDVAPTPTLTPATLKVKEETLVYFTCSAPAPCLSHPPTLTWTPDLGAGPETMQENQDKTKVKISVVTFTASRRHHGKTINCTATYNRRDRSTKSATTSLIADISFAPHILPSSDCTKAAAQLTCSCDTVGNPSPTLHWYLDGLPVNQSDKFEISNEPLNDTGPRSIITVNQPQRTNLSTLLCCSSNSLGSATLRFYIYGFEPHTSAQALDCSGRVAVPVFIVTVVFLTAALTCALLFTIRSQRSGRHDLTKGQCKADTSTAVTSRCLTSEKGNKVSLTTDEDIYVNISMMRNMSNMPSSHLGHQQVASNCSEKKKKKEEQEGSDVVYSSVIWKTKMTKGRNPSGSSYLEEERCAEGGVCRNYVRNALEMEGLYDDIVTRKDVKKRVYRECAQVHFRDQNITDK